MPTQVKALDWHFPPPASGASFSRPTAQQALFDPADIPTLHTWLRADSLLTLSDGDPVTTWTDYSGNGHSPTQANALKRPTWHANAIGGKPALRFLRTRGDHLLAAGVGLAHPHTMFFVIKPEAPASLGGEYDVFFDGFYANQDAVYLVGSAGSTWVAWNSPNVSQHLIPIGPTAHVVTVLANTGASQLGVDGAATAAPGAVNGFTAITLGTFGADSGIPYNGDMAEVIIYSSALSPANIALIETYLKTKYGIA